MFSCHMKNVQFKHMLCCPRQVLTQPLLGLTSHLSDPACKFGTADALGESSPTSLVSSCSKLLSNM